jgi:hypothetical protein
MTCIVSLIDNGTVYMGGDSAGVAGLSISIRADEKVFVNGPFLMGFTTSFRMGQLLRYKFTPPNQLSDKTDMAFMVTDFIDSVRDCFGQNGFGKTSEKTYNEGGTFLVGYKNNLYHIDSDFQVGQTVCGYDSVGCGASIALGSLHSTVGKNPRDRVRMALEAAAAHSAGVAAPFLIIRQSKSKK